MFYLHEIWSVAVVLNRPRKEISSIIDNLSYIILLFSSTPETRYRFGKIQFKSENENENISSLISGIIKRFLSFS